LAFAFGLLVVLILDTVFFLRSTCFRVLGFAEADFGFAEVDFCFAVADFGFVTADLAFGFGFAAATFAAAAFDFVTAFVVVTAVSDALGFGFDSPLLGSFLFPFFLI
jgi:hypothetical protein